MNLFSKMLNDALENHYAIGAFNIIDLEAMYAVCEVAEKTKSPVICAISEQALAYMGDEAVLALKNIAKAKYTVPICFHLDHGSTVELCKHAVDIGFDSVMIDLSNKSIEENIEGTKEVVAYAHSKNCGVEAELGSLKGTEEDVETSVAVYTNPDEAKYFYEKTQVDALAIAIGTSHGAYKFKETPKLRLDILEDIQKLLPNLPLVLHGSSSINPKMVEKINQNGGEIQSSVGIPEEFLQKASKEHICKVNIDSDLRIALIASLREYFNLKKNSLNTKELLRYAQDAQSEVIEYKIKNIFFSDNKA